MTRDHTKAKAHKPRPELLPPIALLQVADVMRFGASKYGARSYAEGASTDRLMGSALRHLLSFQASIDIDEESSLPHLAHAAANILIMLDLIARGKLKDDRN